MPRAKASSQPSVLLGRPEPRLSTQPLRRLNRHTSLGYEAVRFAEDVLGVQVLPWQRWWLIHALETDASGGFRYRTVLTLVARQNGKTFLLKILALYFMYLGRARLVLGAAQSLDIARESWQGAVDMATSDPELAAEVEVVRRANGEQELRLVGGARYRIAAATRSAGRGLSVDLLILDELREHRDWLSWAALSKTTMARPNALTVAISNAGDDASLVLNHLREASLAGTDPTLGLFEWSAEDGCDLDDRRALAQANPSMGHPQGISEQALASARATDPPATYRTECLCQRVDALDEAIPLAAWKDCRDPAGTLTSIRNRVAVGVDVALDSAHVSAAAAAVLDDGRVRVEVVGAWPTTEQARAQLPALLDRIAPRIVCWYPGGPSGALATTLRPPKPDAGRKHPTVPWQTIELKGVDATEACMGFADLVSGRRVLHPGDPLLDNHVANASKHTVGDGWRFARRGGLGHVDCVYAAAGAVHAALTVPVKPRLRPVVIVGRRAS